MRYLIHKVDGSIASAMDAQGAANIARPGDIEEDTKPGNPFPFVAWRAEVIGIVGAPFATRADALRHASTGV